MATAFYYQSGQWTPYNTAQGIDLETGSFSYISQNTQRQTTAQGTPATFESLGIARPHPNPSARYFLRLPGAGGPSLWAIVPGPRETLPPFVPPPPQARPRIIPAAAMAAAIAAAQMYGPKMRFFL